MDRRAFLRNSTQLGLLLGTGSAFSEASVAGEGDVFSRTPSLSLNGEWAIATDERNIGRHSKWFKGAVAGAATVRVPGILQETFPDYHGLVWYWKELLIPRNKYDAGRYLLKFGPVDYEAEVWVNSVSVGSHQGSETGFSLDITDAVRPGAQNVIAVRVLNPDKVAIDGIVLADVPHSNAALTYSAGSGFDAGGLMGPVELLLTPPIFFDDVYVRPDWKTGIVHIEGSLRNYFKSQVTAQVQYSVAHSPNGQTLAMSSSFHSLSPGRTVVTVDIQVEDHQLWELTEPHLYRVGASVQANSTHGVHEVSVRCGFRDFRVTDGYFRLNGRRLFLRCTHTGNHCPYSYSVSPPGAPDLLRLDMLYAKASGFNTVRDLSGPLTPYQLDLCDELGLLVYEEPRASWLLKDSPKMTEYYHRSLSNILLRDRNHACVAIWGLLNETKDGPVFREAVSSLALLRNLDPLRLVLLSSGRWDGHLGIGSISNPGSDEWQFEWGQEHRGGGSSDTARLPDGTPDADGVPAYDSKMGDVHFYPQDPARYAAIQAMRQIGAGGKPVFLSEAGIGSNKNVIREIHNYQQADVPPNAGDYVFLKTIMDRFTADWIAWGFDSVYPFPESFLEASDAAMARHRLLVFNAVRSNAKLCGYSVTGMLDHGYTGEGLWTFWRKFKPGIIEVLQNGWSPVRWCLFANPTHIYSGQSLELEAVIANEDILKPGNYPAFFRVWGPEGHAWSHSAQFQVPQLRGKQDGPLAISVMKETAVISGPAGTYSLIPSLPPGAAPPQTSWDFYLSDAAALPKLAQTVRCWGIPNETQDWLKLHGVVCEPLTSSASSKCELILVGDISSEPSSLHLWRELASRMARGAQVLFVSPAAFNRGDDAAGWMPLEKKGSVTKFYDWLYHSECVAKAHPIFDGLQANAMLNWYYYGPMIPRYRFHDQQSSENVIAAAFATGYTVAGAYSSGTLLTSFRFYAGRFWINAFPVLAELGKHPVADRMLLNMIQHAASTMPSGLEALPSDFESRLRAIGFV